MTKELLHTLYDFYYHDEFAFVEATYCLAATASDCTAFVLVYEQMSKLKLGIHCLSQLTKVKEPMLLKYADVVKFIAALANAMDLGDTVTTLRVIGVFVDSQYAIGYKPSDEFIKLATALIYNSNKQPNVDNIFI